MQTALKLAEFIELRCYAPGDGDLSFVVIDTRTLHAANYKLDYSLCNAICPPGWKVYDSHGNFRAQKIKNSGLTKSQKARLISWQEEAAYCHNLMKQATNHDSATAWQERAAYAYRTMEGYREGFEHEYK